MQTLVHADIFFFVTTIAVILVAIVLVIVLIYIAIILADIRELSRTIKKEGAEIIGDVHAFRDEVKEEAKYSGRNNPSAVAAFLSFISSVMASRKSKHTNK
jgi:uncharacterized membrane protein